MGSKMVFYLTPFLANIFGIYWKDFYLTPLLDFFYLTPLGLFSLTIDRFYNRVDL